MNTRGTLATSTRESGHRQSSVKGYRNGARKIKGVTITTNSKKRVCTRQKNEEDIHLTLKNGTAFRPV